MSRTELNQSEGREGGRGSLEASPWVERFIGGIKSGGVIADVACGRGRHMRLGLGRGYRMVGIDRDLSGLADLDGAPDVELIEADLESGRPLPFTGRQFDGVIVTDYLWRPIFDDILACVGSSGVLIYETFAAAHARLGTRPSRPEFLLQPNELIDRCSPHLTVIAYEQAHLTRPRAKIVQRIVAVGPMHPWCVAPPIPGNAQGNGAREDGA
jgi:hypothetical protein